MASSSRDTLSQIESIRTVGFAVLDGGFVSVDGNGKDKVCILSRSFSKKSTHLEDVLKKDISSSPLWSASLLRSEDGCSSIIRTHFDFLEAGAQVISTSTYQASPLSFSRAGIGKDASRALLLRSVDLADQARKIYLEKHPNAIETPFISLSLGPFGAAQSDGSEYTGIYYDPSNNLKQPATLEDMIAFHYDRLQIIAAEPLIWSQVDLLAFETIPRLDEAEAIKQALERLYANSDNPQYKPAYISFVFPDGKGLPFPPEQEGNTNSQEHFDEIARCVSTFEGVGVNCTKPYFLPELVERLTRAIGTVSSENRKGTRPYLFLYPDGGLVWDGIAKAWKEDKREEDEGKDVKKQSTWTRKVMEAAKLSGVTKQTNNENNNSTSVWQGCFVGGCCKSTTTDIQSLRIEIQQMQMLLR